MLPDRPEDRPGTRRRDPGCGSRSPTYFEVVLLDDEPVPDVPLDDEDPVPEPLVLPLVPEPLMLPLDGVLDDEEPVPEPLMLPVELLGLVLDELLDDGVLLDVSVLVDEELDEAGGVTGVVAVVVLLLLLEGAGGVTVVVRSSFFSQPATPIPTATASALATKMLDFIENSFQCFCRG